jgi:hypothetical protein
MTMKMTMKMLLLQKRLCVLPFAGRLPRSLASNAAAGLFLLRSSRLIPPSIDEITVASQQLTIHTIIVRTVRVLRYGTILSHDIELRNTLNSGITSSAITSLGVQIMHDQQL